MPTPNVKRRDFDLKTFLVWLYQPIYTDNLFPKVRVYFSIKEYVLKTLFGVCVFKILFMHSHAG